MDRISFFPADHAPEAPAGLQVDILGSLAAHFGSHAGRLTNSGREGIAALLAHLGLQRSDEVFISTTFDYPNVSSCVTCSVFNVCKPSRVLTGNTKLILVIHEFGVPHEGTPDLQREARRRGIPLLEDCAHTITSVSEQGWRVGALGDWALVSFPKLFPVATGGALFGPVDAVAADGSQRGRELQEVWPTVAGQWWRCQASLDERKRATFRALERSFAPLGLNAAYPLSDRIAPWFFPLRAPGIHGRLIAAARAKGIDCTLWHGTDIVIYPCHPFLTDEHVETISAVAAEAVR